MSKRWIEYGFLMLSTLLIGLGGGPDLFESWRVFGCAVWVFVGFVSAVSASGYPLRNAPPPFRRFPLAERMHLFPLAFCVGTVISGCVMLAHKESEGTQLIVYGAVGTVISLIGLFVGGIVKEVGHVDEHE